VSLGEIFLVHGCFNKNPFPSSPISICIPKNDPGRKTGGWRSLCFYPYATPLVLGNFRFSEFLLSDFKNYAVLKK
jgi:hypothetical protein